MKLKVGDAVAWKHPAGAIRTGQYTGNHVYRLKSEKKPVKGVDEKLVRIWPTRLAVSARKLQDQVKKGSVAFVLVSTDDLVKVP